jgi:CheY-like chemotaxis protein
VVCDDDSGVRSVVSLIARDLGHEVVGEGETPLAGIELITRHEPDVVVLDLSLAYGSGSEVVPVALEHGCRVVVFSAFADELVSGNLPSDVVVIRKPDFIALEAALVASGEAPSEERRRHPSPQGPAAGIDDNHAFYTALSQAMPDDALVSVELIVGAPERRDMLVSVARRVVRAQDRVLPSPTGVRMLLIGGTADATRAVLDRLAAGMNGGTSELAWAGVVIGAGESPTDAFERLKRVPMQADAAT